MPDLVGLTHLQIAILTVLWEHREATTQDVCEALNEERPLAPTTVATLLSRLERKGVIEHRKRGRQYVYRATVPRSEVRGSKVRALMANLFDGDPAALMGHLVRTGDVDADELRRIRALVDEAEQATEDGDDRAP